MSTRTERKVAILRALMVGIAEMFDDAETSEDQRGHLRANVETVLDHIIEAVYEDAAFSQAVVSSNAMTSMLYANARTCYRHGAVQASVMFQRMAAAAFQAQRDLFAGPRRGPLVDVLAKLFDDHGPEGEMTLP